MVRVLPLVDHSSCEIGPVSGVELLVVLVVLAGEQLEHFLFEEIDHLLFDWSEVAREPLEVLVIVVGVEAGFVREKTVGGPRIDCLGKCHRGKVDRDFPTLHKLLHCEFSLRILAQFAFDHRRGT